MSIPVANLGAVSAYTASVTPQPKPAAPASRTGEFANGSTEHAPGYVRDSVIGAPTTPSGDGMAPGDTGSGRILADGSEAPAGDDGTAASTYGSLMKMNRTRSVS
jgi:hypothetical protein